MKRESGCKDICIRSLYPISSPWFSFQHPVIFIQPIPRILIFLLSFYINKTASIFFFNFHLSILTFYIFLLSRNYLQYVQSLILCPFLLLIRYIFYILFIVCFVFWLFCWFLVNAPWDYLSANSLSFEMPGSATSNKLQLQYQIKQHSALNIHLNSWIIQQSWIRLFGI